VLSLLSLAFRNLLRNRVRTLLTLGAIGSGMAVFMLMITLATGSYADMVNTAVREQAGHVVVQAKGWQELREPTLLVEDARAIDATIVALAPDAVVTQRLMFGGSLMSADNTTIAQMLGVEPNDEGKINDLAKKVTDGEWLGEEDTRGILIGFDMAERLDVEIGDKLVFMSQQKGQTETQSRLFRLRGVFRTGAASLDGFAVAVHIDAARALIGSEAGANQVAVHLPHADGADALQPQIAQALKGEDLDVLHWRDAVPDLMGMIAVDKQSNDAIMMILGIIVALGVLNAILMSTLERTREFGVMMAVGMPARRVAALVLTEGALLGVFGMAFGVLLGMWPSLYLIETGLDMRASMGETYEVSGIAVSALIKGAWDVPRISQYAIGVVLFTILAAAWPAWRVSRLTPVDAMRHH